MSESPESTEDPRSGLAEAGKKPASVASTVTEDAPESEYVVKRRPMWPFFAVLGVIIASVAGLVFYLTSRPDPFKVLVAIDVNGQWWEGSKPAAVLADKIADGLQKVGFEPIKGGDPKVDKVLSKAKSPEEAARKLGAGFVIYGSLSPQLTDHPVEGGFVEARTNTKLTVRYVTDSEGQAAEVPITSWSGGETKAEALDLMAEHVADRIFDAALPKLFEHEVIKSKIDRGDVAAVVRLDDAKKFLEIRGRRLDEVKKAYDKVNQDHAEANDPVKITYHGGFHEQDYLGGVGEAGPLLLTADLSPFIRPSNFDLAWITQLETLAWRGPDGKDKLIWSGYHIMGYPSAAPGGFPVVFVEDLFGRAKTITVAEADGTSRRVRIDPKARYVNPEVSPKGKAAALYEKACRTCAASFTVISLSDGKALYFRASGGDDAFGEGAESYGGYTWLDDNQAAFLVDGKPKVIEKDEKGEDAPPDTWVTVQELRAVDISQSPPLERLVAQLDVGERCQSPEASRDGKQVAMTCSSQKGWVLTFVDSMNGEKTLSEERAAAPTWSPDGKKIAFERSGNIFVYDVASKQATQLTKNDFVERLPRFSLDGKRIYFESQLKDPNNNRRIVSVPASIEVP
ncbi:MAG: PD40 domain-containing protein [Myxococcales bacterium]|nr:PD40 domain-containing protein [Myxococcales bacterium]